MMQDVYKKAVQSEHNYLLGYAKRLRRSLRFKPSDEVYDLFIDNLLSEKNDGKQRTNN